MRKRNINLSGKLNIVEKFSQRSNLYPKDTKTKEHIEKLMTTSASGMTQRIVDIYDHDSYPMIGGKSAQMQIRVNRKVTATRQ